MMNTKQHNKKKPEVYSISGFRDTLASPVFYPVIVVAMVLGLASIFGFVQNPLKLKSMVTVIQQKVATSNLVNDSMTTDQNYMLINKPESTSTSEKIQATNALDLFTDIDANSTEKMPVAGDIERIAFNYDVTSESFWTDLDSSNLETATEEMHRKEKESSTFGAPLRIDYQENLPADFSLENDSIYAINTFSRF